MKLAPIGLSDKASNGSAQMRDTGASGYNVNIL